MSFVPTRVFFTKGVGRHKEQLSSFELALREAKIAATNIVKVLNGEKPITCVNPEVL